MNQVNTRMEESSQYKNGEIKSIQEWRNQVNTGMGESSEYKNVGIK